MSPTYRGHKPKLQTISFSPFDIISKAYKNKIINALAIAIIYLCLTSDFRSLIVDLADLSPSDCAYNITCDNYACIIHVALTLAVWLHII